MRVPLIRQHDEMDCSCACLSMILEYYGKKTPMAVIRQAIKVDQYYGANIFGIVAAAKQFSVEGCAYTGSAEDIWVGICDGTYQIPAIIRIYNRAGSEHFAVAAGIRNGLLTVCDPDAGRIRMTQEDFAGIYCGGIVVFEKMPGFQKENTRRGQMTRFTDLILKQKKILAVIGILSLIVTGISMAGAYLFQWIIDNGLNNLDAMGESQVMRSLTVILTGLSVLYVFRAVVQLLRGKLLTVMGRNIDLPLMLGYCNHVAELPAEFFTSHKTGDVISRFADASRICDALSNAALTVMLDVVMVAACSVLLFRQSHVLFFIASGIFLAYALVSVAFIKPLDKMNRASMEKSSIFTSHLKESIDGMLELKAAQAEGSLRERTEILFKDSLNTALHGGMLSVGKDTLIEAISSVGTLVLIGVGVVQIIHGDITLGTLVSFNSLLSYYLSPIQNLIELQANLQSAVVAAYRLNDVLLLKAEDKDGAIPEGEIRTIAVEHVDFRYGNRELVLKDLNFSLQKGEQIALVGESGCGKSTVTKLLMGMYTPEKGEITVNGIPMHDLSLTWLRSQIAYASQNISLFSGSVRENLCLGLPATDIPEDEEICKVLKDCCCDFVLEMPYGIDSMLEENGCNLSGGQRQRLAIARAILRHPHVLILDEATSALDAITESRIEKAIHELLPDVAVIMVAHQLSTVAKCAQIHVLDENGHIAENGTHQELLELNQKYAELWNQQNCGLKCVA